MNTGNTDRYESHDAVEALLPWYVNGTVDDTERALVAKHLEVCLRCRAALAREREIAAAMREVEVEALASRGAFNDLRARVSGAGPVRRGGVRAFLAQLMPRHVFVVATLAVLVVAVTLLMRSPEPLRERIPGPSPTAGDFRTLAAPDRDATVDDRYLRVVFAETLSDEGRREILASAGAAIVSGPSARGVYTIVPLSAARDSVPYLLATLRADAGVAFVEPVGGSNSQLHDAALPP